MQVCGLKTGRSWHFFQQQRIRFSRRCRKFFNINLWKLCSAATEVNQIIIVSCVEVVWSCALVRLDHYSCHWTPYKTAIPLLALIITLKWLPNISGRHYESNRKPKGCVIEFSKKRSVFTLVYKCRCMVVVKLKF